MKRRWGKVVATAVQKSIASIEAAESLAILELGPGKCHALHGDRDGQFALHLTKTMRLVFVPADNPRPTLRDGGLDRKRVTRVRVVEVGDYHD